GALMPGFGNKIGVLVSGGASNNSIRDLGPPGNVISGKAQYGVELTDVNTNIVVRNSIGTDVSGLAAAPNGFGGVLLQNDTNDGLAADVISANTGPGVEI